MMEPSIGQWDTHRIIASKPLANKGETVYAYDIETWGLDASAFAFGCTHNVNTGEERVFFTKEALREFLESEAPCIVYAHNGSRYDTLALYTPRELYNARKVASGTRIFELEPRYLIGDEWVNSGVKYRDSRHLLSLPLSDIAVSVGMAKGITPQAFIDGPPRGITEQDIEYCHLDNRILAAVLKRLRILYANLCGVNPESIQLPLTVASMAYRTWCEMEGSWPENWTWTDARKRVRKMASCRSVLNECFRQAEHGGRVQVACTPGEPVEGIVSYDANSLYTSVMNDE